MRKLKKAFAISAILLALTFTAAGTAFAGVVYYKGVALSWDYGRDGFWGDHSYSTVQSGVFEHSATANTTFSGWKQAGERAHARQFIGVFGRATAFWNARGEAYTPYTPRPPVCLARAITC